MKPEIKDFFDPATFSFTYVVRDPDSRSCAIVDPVLDFDPASGKMTHDSADAVIEYVQAKDLSVEWILETHVHADHLSAAAYLKSKLGGMIGIGNNVAAVQQVFGGMFNAGPDFATDGSQFDRLFSDGAAFRVGNLEAQVLHTPGHTPACATYVFDGAAFVGDTLFQPDFGTARTDFPGGDAATLFASIQRILALPAETELYMCHDYLTGSRTTYEARTTVAEEKAKNIHVHDGITAAEFVSFREERNATLAAPRLLLPSVQFNMRAGQLPPPEDNGMQYLKLPVRAA